MRHGWKSDSDTEPIVQASTVGHVSKWTWRAQALDLAVGFVFCLSLGGQFLFTEFSMDFETLKTEDISGKTIFLDVDGSLIPEGQLDFDPRVIESILNLKKRNNVFLATNMRDKTRLDQLEAILQVPILTRKFRKPSAKILSEVGTVLDKNNYIVMGDRILIDGIFAARIGGTFIRLQRKISWNEPIFTKFINFIDDIVWKMVKKLF